MFGKSLGVDFDRDAGGYYRVGKFQETATVEWLVFETGMEMRPVVPDFVEMAFESFTGSSDILMSP